MRSSAPLYDLLAPTYEEHFAVLHRRAYDELAWDICRDALPEAPAVTVDVGCGVGRWAERLLDAGYSLTGIEPAPAMADQAARRLARWPRTQATLLRSRVEDVELTPGSVDAVLAMGSLQYTDDPVRQVVRLAGWLRPGGVLAVLVDNLQALVLELLAAGREEEALARLTTRRGVWRVDEIEADLHLLDSATLRRAYDEAGLDVVRVSGLLVGASAHGRDGLRRRLDEDFEGTLAAEGRLAAQPELADLGKQLLIVGRRRSR
ncbi:bifunctional 2-polyprenyl-6-hydroxyphenol methylase/3-demethylubiquinol 3-O-methyltransferase UbiG [uncultured Nocardioides sp.]|uniref:class I SAM-dependent methyltransferase n=1 Tax=uncultured Nocardioides sp. TaxID=198441 RepID=UPI0025D53FF0|nr:class I SAM-dependent methyltransferase [uncultured Nocardioides sp.]